MNIFVLDPDPFVAAEMHCDKHVVKMIVEYAQLLSTAHRLLDGNLVIAQDTRTLDQFTSPLRPKKFWLLEGERPMIKHILLEGDHLYDPDLLTEDCYVARWAIENPVCYNATHANHPSAVWARENEANYQWLLCLLAGCLLEYTSRYGKTHATDAMLMFFRSPPKNIPAGEQTPFPQAMPVEYQVPNDPVAAYKAFYVGSKSRFAKWTNRPVPEWFATAVIQEGRDVAHFARTR